jgi:hypothetical protein
MSEQLSKALNKTIGRMLRPLVKLLMHQGITYTGFIPLLKETYVEVAIEEAAFQLDDKRQTDSRVSLLTGVHRKEVKRIREKLGHPFSEKEIKASISAQIMAKWLGHPDYADERGEPRPLQRNHGQNVSFEDLVFSISRDKHPRSILDDWLRQGLVEIDDDQLIHLKQKGYTASHDIEEKLFFAGKNISEHLETVTHNLTSPEQPRFDRSVYYHRLSEQSVSELDALARDELLSALNRVNQKAAQLQQADRDLDEKPLLSVHIGGYFATNHSRKNDKS